MSSHPDHPDEGSENSNRRAGPLGKPATPSFWRSVKMVGWSFLGIRKNSEYQQDMTSVNPIHIVVVAIGGVLVFVVSLIAFVNWVVAK